MRELRFRRCDAARSQPAPFREMEMVEVVGTLVAFFTPRPRRETSRVTGNSCPMVLAIMPPACLVLFGGRHRGDLLLGQCSLGELPWTPAKSNGSGRRAVVTRQGRNVRACRERWCRKPRDPNGSSQIILNRKDSPEVEFGEGFVHGSDLPRKSLGEREAHHTGYEPIVQTPWSSIYHSVVNVLRWATDIGSPRQERPVSSAIPCQAHSR